MQQHACAARAGAGIPIAIAYRQRGHAQRTIRQERAPIAHRIAGSNGFDIADARFKLHGRAQMQPVIVGRAAIDGDSLAHHVQPRPGKAQRRIAGRGVQGKPRRQHFG